MDSDPLDPKILSDPALYHSRQGEVDQLKNMAKGGPEQLEKVAAQFESIFLNFLIKQMWESVERSDLLPESPGRQIYDGMITNMLADHIAQNRGIGIADALVNQLKGAAEAYEALEKSGKAPREDASEDHGEETITNAGEA